MADKDIKLNLPPAQIMELATSALEYFREVAKDNTQSQNQEGLDRLVKFYEDVVGILTLAFDSMSPSPQPSLLEQAMPFMLVNTKYKS